MKVRALRGVCIGPGQHLLPGDEADVDNGTAVFLANIGAVERLPEPPAAESDSKAPAAPEPTPAKPGKKEK